MGTIRINKATPQGIRYACLHFHYAKKVPSVKQGFNVYNDKNEWCGVICYGVGANLQIAKPYDKWQGQVLELVRVALNGKQGHGNTSAAVAMSLKAMKKMYPWVDLIISYADMDQEHFGTLYQATNWIYTGLKNANTKGGAYIIFGKKMHGRSVAHKGWKQSYLWLKEHVDPNVEEVVTKGKHKYLYPMNKQTRKRIQILSVPYPKKNKTEE